MSKQANTTRERAVLAKYLVEAHGKEQQLETALQAQIAITKQADLERSLSDHLQVTREQITALEVQLRRVGQPSSPIPGVDAVGTAVTLASTVLNKGLALAKGPLVALRGSSQADRELRVARDCYWNEAEEIAHYRVIEAVAERLGDAQTADLARRHRVQEESMQATLERVIGELSGDVLEAEATSIDRAAA